MPLTPQFFAARAAEQRNRLLSYAAVSDPLRLPLASGRVVTVPQRHLTLRALVELELVASPFVTGGPVTAWDAYRVLWRLHPHFLRRDEPAPLGARLRALVTRLRLAWLTGRLLWPAGAAVLRDRLAAAYQDSPAEAAGEGEDESPTSAPPHCAADDLCHLFARHYGFTRDQVLDAPLAGLLQLLRAATLAQPDGDIQVIDPSDALLGA